jgi:acetyl-CoA acetyltransferase
MQKEKGRKVFVVGVGMTKFEKPGRREDFDYPQMAKESAESALRDAGLSYSAIEQAVVGYVYGTTHVQWYMYKPQNIRRGQHMWPESRLSSWNDRDTHL